MSVCGCKRRPAGTTKNPTKIKRAGHDALAMTWWCASTRSVKTGRWHHATKIHTCWCLGLLSSGMTFHAGLPSWLSLSLPLEMMASSSLQCVKLPLTVQAAFASYSRPESQLNCSHLCLPVAVGSSVSESQTSSKYSASDGSTSWLAALAVQSGA